MKLLALLLLAAASLAAANEVLIVADEFPAMQVLAKKLEAGAAAKCTLVEQTAIPAGLARYSALIVYIHRSIGEAGGEGVHRLRAIGRQADSAAPLDQLRQKEEPILVSVVPGNVAAGERIQRGRLQVLRGH